MRRQIYRLNKTTDIMADMSTYHSPTLRSSRRSSYPNPILISSSSKQSLKIPQSRVMSSSWPQHISAITVTTDIPHQRIQEELAKHSTFANMAKQHITEEHPPTHFPDTATASLPMATGGDTHSQILSRMTLTKLEKYEFTSSLIPVALQTSG